MSHDAERTKMAAKRAGGVTIRRVPRKQKSLPVRAAERPRSDAADSIEQPSASSLSLSCLAISGRPYSHCVPRRAPKWLVSGHAAAQSRGRSITRSTLCRHNISGARPGAPFGRGDVVRLSSDSRGQKKLERAFASSPLVHTFPYVALREFTSAPVGSYEGTSALRTKRDNQRTKYGCPGDS